MKRTLLLLLALLLMLSATGCFAIAVPPKAVQTEYDEQGRVIKEGIPDRQGSFYTYEYDENGFLSTRNEYLTEDQPTPYCVTVYYYDGVILSHSVGTYQDGSTQNTDYHSTTGQPQTITTLDVNNKVTGVEEYDEQGKIIRMDMYRDGIIDKSQHYDPAHEGDERHVIGYDIYDDQGQLAVSHQTTYDEDGTSHNKTYSRDPETGELYLSRCIIAKDGVGVEEQYDVDGNMISSTPYESKIHLTPDTVTTDGVTVEYDEDGNMVFSITTEDQ